MSLGMSGKLRGETILQGSKQPIPSYPLSTQDPALNPHHRDHRQTHPHLHQIDPSCCLKYPTDTQTLLALGPGQAFHLRHRSLPTPRPVENLLIED